MSEGLVIVALCVHFGWFYDETQYTDSSRTIVAVAILGVAFIAWCVEQVCEAIRERNDK